MRQERFEELVRAALESLPDEFLRRLENVEVAIEEWPSLELIREMKLGPGQVPLGVYQGLPLTRRGASYGLTLPDRIVIFRGPIEALGHDEEAIKEQVRRVVMHEVGHHFGLSENHLRGASYGH